jgi:cytochrome c
MKKSVLIIMALAVVALTASLSLAANQTPVERGKALFEKIGFAGGQVACSSCHFDGTGLKGVANKTKFRVAGQVQNSLEDAVNACIKYAAKGTPIPVDSQEMKDIVSYIRFIGK